MPDDPSHILRRLLQRLALTARASTLARGIAWGFDRWSELGTAGYSTEIRHRLKILNLIAALIAITTGIYAVQNVFMDFQRFLPIILINAAMFLAALCIPLLHRFGPIAAGITLVICEYVTLVALSAYLGRNAGLHLQLFVVAAASFVVLGFERLRLILLITVCGLALHLYVWFRFPPEAALIEVAPLGRTDFPLR